MDELTYNDIESKRLDKFIALEREDLSRSRIQALINDGHIMVNARSCKPSLSLKCGDRISIDVPDVALYDVKPEAIPLDILYEDDDVLIVNKPKDMVVHPAPGHEDNTLVNAVLYHCKDGLSGINGVLRPGIVHRIDKDTTGSLLIAKSDVAHIDLAKQLEEHSIHRVYEGIVNGVIKDDEGVIEAPIGRDKIDRKKMAVTSDGKQAVTHFRVLERFSAYTYVQFQLKTGRTHQIRVHMKHIGHPLLGDAVYGPKKCKYNLCGQTLHAKTIGFVHPITNKYVEVEAPLPDYFVKLLRGMR